MYTLNYGQNARITVEKWISKSEPDLIYSINNIYFIYENSIIEILQFKMEPCLNFSMFESGSLESSALNIKEFDFSNIKEITSYSLESFLKESRLRNKTTLYNIVLNRVTQINPQFFIEKKFLEEEDGMSFAYKKIESLTPSYIESHTKEEKKMINNSFGKISKNIKIGKYEGDEIKYSLKGIAFKDKDNNFFTYKDDNAIDVSSMTVDVPVFMLPIAVNQVKPNDIILFKNTPVLVKEKVEDGIKVINPIAGEVRTIIPEMNMFGFSYITKIVNPFEGIIDTASSENPFGDLLPLMFLEDNTMSDDSNIIKFLIMSQMMNKDNNTDLMSNPMCMYLLLGSNNLDFLLPMMMSGSFDIASLKNNQGKGSLKEE